MYSRTPATTIATTIGLTLALALTGCLGLEMDGTHLASSDRMAGPNFYTAVDNGKHGRTLEVATVNDYQTVCPGATSVRATCLVEHMDFVYSGLNDATAKSVETAFRMGDSVLIEGFIERERDMRDREHNVLYVLSAYDGIVDADISSTVYAMSDFRPWCETGTCARYGMEALDTGDVSWAYEVDMSHLALNGTQTLQVLDAFAAGDLLVASMPPDPTVRLSEEGAAYTLEVENLYIPVDNQCRTDLYDVCEPLVVP